MLGKKSFFNMVLFTLLFLAFSVTTTQPAHTQSQDTTSDSPSSNLKMTVMAPDQIKPGDELEVEVIIRNEGSPEESATSAERKFSASFGEQDFPTFNVQLDPDEKTTYRPSFSTDGLQGDVELRIQLGNQLKTRSVTVTSSDSTQDQTSQDTTAKQPEKSSTKTDQTSPSSGDQTATNADTSSKNGQPTEENQAISLSVDHPDTVTAGVELPVSVTYQNETDTNQVVSPKLQLGERVKPSKEFTIPAGEATTKTIKFSTDDLIGPEELTVQAANQESNSYPEISPLADKSNGNAQRESTQQKASLNNTSTSPPDMNGGTEPTSTEKAPEKSEQNPYSELYSNTSMDNHSLGNQDESGAHSSLFNGSGHDWSGEIPETLPPKNKEPEGLDEFLTAIQEEHESLKEFMKNDRASRKEMQEKLMDRVDLLEQTSERLLEVHMENKRLKNALQDETNRLAEITQENQQLTKQLRGIVEGTGAEVAVNDQHQVKVRLPEHVLFNLGEHEIHDRHQDTLDELADALADVENRNIRVEGHTDNVPISSDRFPSNWQLAAERSIQVTSYLVDNSDLQPSDLEAVSHGQYKPRVPNDSKENRAKNRRVEITLEPELQSE